MGILRTQFLNSYRARSINWGFPSGPNHLGELVYRRTYRRGSENWQGTLERVVEGTFEHLERHCVNHGITYHQDHFIPHAEEMYERFFTFKCLPPGRGLWTMGTDYVRERGSACLNNCAFISTKDMAVDPIEPFTFLMDMSMLGVGVGFDTRGANQAVWHPRGGYFTYVIPDSREGWVESLRQLLLWGFGLGFEPTFDYSEIRPYGSIIKGFGGVASGPDPLRRLHERVREIIHRNQGKAVTSRDIVDIQNMIGECVVAGNVRRTAELAIGDKDDEHYLDLKNYVVNPDRGAYGWTSNNSVWASPGMDYHQCAERTRINGEPGYVWLDNMRAYGRMIDPPNWKDREADGTNPCVEQTLFHRELCCLVENFLHRAESYQDFRKPLEVSWLYAKIVTLIPTHYEPTNEVIRRNRRVGSSLSGVAQFVHARGMDELRGWCDRGYHEICNQDFELSKRLKVNESIKKTSIKPSGTVSILAGATPGCHYPIMTTYIRRVRFPANNPDWRSLRDAGYHVESAIVGYEDYPACTRPVYDPGTMVVEFPVDLGENAPPTEWDTTLDEKVGIAVELQKYWADNQVSCTASFKEEEGCEIESILGQNDRVLKGISFLPLREEQVFPQMPYEKITREKYCELTSRLKPVVWSSSESHEDEEKSCDGGVCEVKR